MYESSDQTLSRFRNSDRPSLQLALDRTVSGAFFGQPVLRNQSTMGFDYGLGLAILTALLFFASILIHELSHAAVAKARGLPVKAITLFALGGVAQIEKEASDAKTEFWIGIAGPITSLLIGILSLMLAAGFGWAPSATNQSPWAAMLGWLGVINIALAIFNMIPGFPLDGGRVLRALLWWSSG
jgi:Zn-dependent protease